MDKLNFTSKEEQVTSVERINRIEIEDGVVTAYFEKRVDGKLTDSYNVDRKLGELSGDMQKALETLVVEAKAWLTAKQNPAPAEVAVDSPVQ